MFKYITALLVASQVFFAQADPSDTSWPKFKETKQVATSYQNLTVETIQNHDKYDAVVQVFLHECTVISLQTAYQKVHVTEKDVKFFASLKQNIMKQAAAEKVEPKNSATFVISQIIERYGKHNNPKIRMKIENINITECKLDENGEPAKEKVRIKV